MTRRSQRDLTRFAEAALTRSHAMIARSGEAFASWEFFWTFEPAFPWKPARGFLAVYQRNYAWGPRGARHASISSQSLLFQFACVISPVTRVSTCDTFSYDDRSPAELRQPAKPEKNNKREDEVAESTGFWSPLRETVTFASRVPRCSSSMRAFYVTFQSWIINSDDYTRISAYYNNDTLMVRRIACTVPCP